MEAAITIIAVVVALVFIIIIASAIKIVRPHERGVLERLGRFQNVLNPGLRLIVPFIDKVQMIDMREQVIDVPPQEVITSDNVIVSVDAVVFYEATDPQRLVYNVANFVMAIIKLAQTSLRNVVGDMQLDQALTSRDTINQGLRNILDDATDKWGVRVVRVEIQRIDPPGDVMSAMHEQMKAERKRRAVVLEADGQREAAIAVAEGQKQSEILRAEANRQRQILEAEGDAQARMAIADAERYRQLTVAEGEAQAITTVYNAIHAGDPSPDLLAIKYLEALGTIADGRATKIFLPADFASGLGAIGAVAELFGAGDGGDEARKARAESSRTRLQSAMASADEERAEQKRLREQAIAEAQRAQQKVAHDLDHDLEALEPHSSGGHPNPPSSAGSQLPPPPQSGSQF